MSAMQRIQNAVIILVVTAFVVYATRDWNKPENVLRDKSLANQASSYFVELRGKTMGTYYKILAYPSEDTLPKSELQSIIEEELDSINSQMSTYDPKSELSEFNAYDQTDWFPVSADTVTVVRTALQIAAQSNGQFDPTIGPLVKLWNFGPARETFEVPAESAIEEASARVGFELVDIQETPPALRKKRPDVYVDLSAIAKGHGVDRLAKRLLETNIDVFLVDIGGELRVNGTKPDGSQWRLAIESPTVESRMVQKQFSIPAGAIATSGNYRNFYERNGQRYSHTIDPTTGKPVTHELASATVIAENCMLADAYATTLMVLGPEDGYNWATEHGLAAFFLIHDGEELRERATVEFIDRTQVKLRTTETPE